MQVPRCTTDGADADTLRAPLPALLARSRGHLRELGLCALSQARTQAEPVMLTAAGATTPSPCCYSNRSSDGCSALGEPGRPASSSGWGRGRCRRPRLWSCAQERKPASSPDDRRRSIRGAAGLFRRIRLLAGSVLGAESVVLPNKVIRLRPPRGQRRAPGLMCLETPAHTLWRVSPCCCVRLPCSVGDTSAALSAASNPRFVTSSLRGIRCTTSTNGHTSSIIIHVVNLGILHC